jgi:hypothetical protein
VTDVVRAVEARRRIAAAEEDMWGFIRERLHEGHSAAALAHIDLDQTTEQSVIYDNDVEVEVEFRRPGDQTVSSARLTLTDALRLVLTDGVEITEIGSTRPRPVVFFAVAKIVTDSSLAIASVRDLRGFGRLVASTAPAPEGSNARTFGSWYQGFCQNSGVQGVNERREDAVEHLRSEYPAGPGFGGAAAIIRGVRADAILTYNERIPPGHEWMVLTRMGDTRVETVSPLPTGKRPRIADVITDALSIEAYGATRKHLPRARGWEQRYEPVPEPDMTAQQRTHGLNVGDESVIGRRPWRAEIMGEWTLLQASADPTGDIATGLVDGRLTIPGTLVAGLPSTGLIDEWRDLGLTERQARVLFADQLGFTDAQIADFLKIARSTVANTLVKARKKISKISKSA